MNYEYYTSNNNGQDDYGLKYIDNQGYGMICKDYKLEFPPQHQDTQPGMEYLMRPRPIFNNPYYRASGKLIGKVAVITGGDSGIGRAVAVGFAKEGASVVIAYYNEHKDAEETKEFIERLGGTCLLLDGDIKETSFCDKIIEETMKKFGRIDILVNNAGVQYQHSTIIYISSK